MSEFKYACPVCGQHIRCDSTQSGTTMECPTCFQKIVAPQAPATDDPKYIITGIKMGERPIPAAVANAGAMPVPVPEKQFPAPAVVFVVMFCVAAAVLFVFHKKIFKAAGGPASRVAVTSDEQPTPVPAPPPPVVGLASVIFAKGDSLVLGAGAAPAEVKDPGQVAFLAAVKADLARPMAFEGPVELTIPPGNGREVPGATGEIQYHASFPGGLVIGVALAGLLPNHEYVLTLNGDAQHAGNNNLPDQLNRTSRQKFYDFSKITTDANGRYQATFGLLLPAGPYEVYFFVKDTTDWKIVLSHNLFKFTVEGLPRPG